ncbi:CD74 molecule, major histocompatibility complex, class II invariant chain a isoform X2 [Fundulus heteroclitus]|uniref:CD74 molecule, major histocompatibility complex, class II invariant chain a isoform X2 n=1 Tax=Fundulus heteroclitus TaxID=8078 RepID=UPI00165CDED7|nr:CD74 molecule, major histocompatibility complex, class II invariant chain a isoform X2 [Fundulus heteroclitus]
MADNQEDAPLARGSVSGSHEVLVNNAGPRGGSNSRAVKIAGLTTLACLLLASQVFTAYMVFNQKQQIHTLQKSSERLGKQMTRTSQVVAPARMAMPMNSLPLQMDFTEDDSKSSKTPLVKLQDTAIVSLEKQVMDLMKDVSLPQFNETFMANLKSMKQQIDESEWKSFESWMRYWLIFQMAQQKPAGPTPQPASMIQTKCQMEAASEPRLANTSPSAMSRAATSPCSAGTPPASAGAWTSTAPPSRAPQSAAAPTVTEVQDTVA